MWIGPLKDHGPHAGSSTRARLLSESSRSPRISKRSCPPLPRGKLTSPSSVSCAPAARAASANGTRVASRTKSASVPLVTSMLTGVSSISPSSRTRTGSPAFAPMRASSTRISATGRCAAPSTVRRPPRRRTSMADSAAHSLGRLPRPTRLSRNVCACPSMSSATPSPRSSAPTSMASADRSRLAMGRGDFRSSSTLAVNGAPASLPVIVEGNRRPSRTRATNARSSRSDGQAAAAAA